MKRKPENIQSGFIPLMPKLLARVKYIESYRLFYNLAADWHVSHLLADQWAKSVPSISARHFFIRLICLGHTMRDALMTVVALNLNVIEH